MNYMHMFACMSLNRQRFTEAAGVNFEASLRSFDKGSYVCEARRPSGGVSRQIAHTPHACDPGRIAGSKDNRVSQSLKGLLH